MKPKVRGEHGGNANGNGDGSGNANGGSNGSGNGGSGGGPVATPETAPGEGTCRPGDEECGALPGLPGGGDGGGIGGLGPEAGTGGQGVPEPLVPEPPTAVPSAPGPAPSGGIALPPPLTAPEQAGPPNGATQMTLTSPTSLSERNAVDWAVVVGIALVAEIGLLWGIACIGLWRRRIALYRAASRAAQPGGILT